MHRVNVPAKFKFVALPVPEIIAIRFLSEVCKPQSWKKEAVGGQGWYRSKEGW